MAGGMKGLYGDAVTDFERLSVCRSFSDTITALASDNWELAKMFQLKTCQHEVCRHSTKYTNHLLIPTSVIPMALNLSTDFNRKQINGSILMRIDNSSEINLPSFDLGV